MRSSGSGFRPDFGKALRYLRPRESPQRQLFQSENPVLSLASQLSFLKSRTVERFVPESSVLEGSEEVTPLGRHLLIRESYDDSHVHGKVRLGRFSCADLGRLVSLSKDKEVVPDRNAIVFLDTETTGLQGGTGMVAFLVGLGYFEDDEFRVVQYFIRDFDEEPSMLFALGDFLQRFKLAVTYNGATFDIPLLETRFTLARLDSPFANMGHLDLLPAARRLWRNTHGSCRLAALEAKVAGFLRGADVPGAMIPRAYFDFLQSQGSAVIRGVVKHNVRDIVSLAALAICACDSVTAEPAALDNPLDLYSLARVFEHTAEWKRSITLYEMTLSGGLTDPLRTKAQESLAAICRRAGLHARSLDLCEQLMMNSDFSMAGYEGAAIHFERIARDGATALRIVEAALVRLANGEQGHRHRVSLQSRRERLRQKAMAF